MDKNEEQMYKIITIVTKKLQYFTDFKCKENYVNGEYKGAITDDYEIYTLSEVVVDGVLTMFPKIYVWYTDFYLYDLTLLIEASYQARINKQKIDIFLNLLQAFATKYSYTKFNGGSSFSFDTPLNKVSYRSKETKKEGSYKLNAKDKEWVKFAVEEARKEGFGTKPTESSDI